MDRYGSLDKLKRSNTLKRIDEEPPSPNIGMNPHALKSNLVMKRNM